MGGRWWRGEKESRALTTGVCRAQSGSVSADRQTDTNASLLSPVMRWGALPPAWTRPRDPSLVSRLRSRDGAPPLTETPELPQENNRLVTSTSIWYSSSLLSNAGDSPPHPSGSNKSKRTGDARSRRHKCAFVDARPRESCCAHAAFRRQRQLSVYRWRRYRLQKPESQWRLMHLQCFWGFLPWVSGRVHLSSASFHCKHPLPALGDLPNTKSQSSFKQTIQL